MKAKINFYEQILEEESRVRVSTVYDYFLLILNTILSYYKLILNSNPKQTTKNVFTRSFIFHDGTSSFLKICISINIELKKKKNTTKFFSKYLKINGEIKLKRRSFFNYHVYSIFSHIQRMNNSVRIFLLVFLRSIKIIIQRPLTIN